MTSFKYETRWVLKPGVTEELEALRRNPRAMQQLNAHMKYVSLRLSAQMFGYTGADEWARSQMTDAERAALAHEAESVPHPLLTEG